MEIRRLSIDEETPMDLLLLADPSRNIVVEYLKSGECFIAESDNQLVGVYVLLPTRPQTVEIVNIAVVEEYHGKGIGKFLVKNAIKTAKKKWI